MGVVEVRPLGDHRYEVRIDDGGPATAHLVTVPPEMLAGLGVGEAAEPVVVEESFAFLLEREPAGAILAEFALPLIGRYFPEYEHELPVRLRRRGIPPPV